MEHDTHLILHHLDDPLRILHWTLDEVAALMIPAFWGLGMERPALGIILSGLSFWSIRKLKKRCGLSTLKHFLYWHLPKSRRHLPHVPGSHIREIIG